MLEVLLFYRARGPCRTEALIEVRLWQIALARRRVLSIPLRQGAGLRSESLQENVVTFKCGIRLPDPACSTLRLSRNKNCSQENFIARPKLFTGGCGGGTKELSSPPVNNFGGTISAAVPCRFRLVGEVGVLSRCAQTGIWFAFSVLRMGTKVWDKIFLRLNQVYASGKWVHVN